MTYQKLRKILNSDWYIQGFSAVPLYLNLTGVSGYLAQPNKLKFTHFIYKHSNKYAEMGYYQSDFSRLYQAIQPELENLPKLKKRYQNDWQKYVQLYKKIDQLKLNKLSNTELFNFLKQCAWGQTYSGGISHIYIEPISIEIEKEFKNELLAYLGPLPKFNEIYAQLTAPTKLSWVSQEERDLIKINKLPKLKKVAAFNKHLAKWFWIENSYSNAKQITLGQLRLKLAKIIKQKLVIESPKHIVKRKQILIKKLNISSALITKIKIIDFISSWQDERKANIYIAISYLDKLLSELASRADIDKTLLLYLSSAELFKLKNIAQLRKLKSKLSTRRQGCFVYQFGITQDYFFTGSRFKKLSQLMELATTKEQAQENSLHGSVANPGTAMGRVAICKNISQINKVKEGDVIVASMTRPEYMPALKKASAIVTDEGGITCHAAIVSRELNKPCVIGTKIATKVLKDGMLVEVKANHGLVKIIKQVYA